MLAENALHIYTDGSSLPSPRRGGIGIRFLLIDSQGCEEIIDSRHAGYQGATNNQMELQACIEALEEARERGLITSVSKIVVHADSRYVVENWKQAVFVWPTRRWTTKTGTPVLNADLWKRLVRAIKNAGRRVDFEWVQGHSKDLHNRAVDKMAKGSAKSALRPALSVWSAYARSGATNLSRLAACECWASACQSEWSRVSGCISRSSGSSSTRSSLRGARSSGRSTSFTRPACWPMDTPTSSRSTWALPTRGS